MRSMKCSVAWGRPPGIGASTRFSDRWHAAGQCPPKAPPCVASATSRIDCRHDAMVMPLYGAGDERGSESAPPPRENREARLGRQTTRRQALEAGEPDARSPLSRMEWGATCVTAEAARPAG